MDAALARTNPSRAGQRASRVLRGPGRWVVVLLAGVLLFDPVGLQAASRVSGSRQTTLAAGSEGEIHTVEIMSFSFQPLEIEIAPGDSVSWTNRDLTAHTATGPDFDTTRIGQGETRVVRFDAPGRFPYNCSFHGNMAGVVIVGTGQATTPARHRQA